MLVRLLLSATVLTYMLGQVDASLLPQLLAGARPLGLAAGAAALLASAACGGLLWHALFPQPALAPGRAVRYTLIAFSLNNLIPTGLAGDVYRIWAVGRDAVPLATACYTVVMDRWCAFLVLLLATAGATAYVHAHWSGLPLTSAGPTLAADAVLAGLLWLLVVAFVGVTFALIRVGRWRWLRLSIPGAEAALPEIAASIRSALRRPRRLCAPLLWGALSLALEAMSVYCAAAALGAPTPLSLMILVPVIRVLHRLPGFVNAIGPQEVAAVALWGAMGIRPELSLSISVVLHGLRLAVGLVGLPLGLTSPLPAAASGEASA